MIFNIIDYIKRVNKILKEVPERTEKILRQRFGIEKERKTLEEIGAGYGITRERVRQIEARGIRLVQNSPRFSDLKKFSLKIKNLIDRSGGLKREDILFKILSPEEKFYPYLSFLLKIEKYFFYQESSFDFYPFWFTKKNSPKIAMSISDALVKLIEREKKLFSEKEILEKGQRELPKFLKINLPKKHLLSYIEVSKKIEKNPFGEYGIASWPEIALRNIGDKAYLLLKKEGRPLHFGELAEIIEEKLSCPANKNTLHNELIKNNKFLLVGRGIYALAEWGYKPGVVKDVISEILKEKGPLKKEEIIKEVKKQRMVKESTILLNLQYFKKDKEGRYYV